MNLLYNGTLKQTSTEQHGTMHMYTASIEVMTATVLRAHQLVYTPKYRLSNFIFGGLNTQRINIQYEQGTSTNYPTPM